MEIPLALSDAQLYPEPLRQVMTQELSIPQILGVPQLARRATQIATQTLTDTRIQRRWTPGARNLLQTGKTALFKTMDPVLHSPRTVSEKGCDFGAAIPGADQEDSMKLMIVPRLIRPQNFLLNRNSNNVRILDFEFAHGILPLRGVYQK